MLKKMNIIPKWVVFLFDLIICSFSLILSHYIRNNLSIDSITLWQIRYNLLILLFVNTVSFQIFKTFSGIIRYTGIQDVIKIFKALTFTVFVLFFTSYLSVQSQGPKIYLNTILVIYFLLSFLLLVSYRELGKFLFQYIRNYNRDRKFVVIYGAGEAGYATKRVLEHDVKIHSQIVAFIDDDFRKINKVVDGIKIISPTEFSDLCKKITVDELIFASFTISPDRRNYIVDVCLDQGVKLKNVPPLERWINGQFSSRQLQFLQIEKLLERETIKINSSEIGNQLSGKRILVTGAAGSIGSEIVRQLLNFHPSLIVLCDNAESPLHQLELELLDMNTSVKFITFLGDIRNKDRMFDLFKQYRPEYVYHAAAYKHVPMMELCPQESIFTNVFGTKVIADLSLDFGVSRFVMISTDKAVNPTNVMGASKRLAEKYVQYLHSFKNNAIDRNSSGIKFITTRFGNVLGSNGSVINRFRHQIERGGPITVTHPEITRYFMTIPEACQLVLEAGSMGKGGEIFVFDMGAPVSITELAKKMIRLYGYSPEKDIEIKYTGLRPGEKLYEELLANSENTIPTYHEKIMIAQEANHQFADFEINLNDLFEMSSNKSDSMAIVGRMKKIIPEYISNNSIFETLDG